MRLGYVIIYVKDVRATVCFYEAAFEQKCRFMDESGNYAEMETGSTALAFVSEEMVKKSLAFRSNRIKEDPSGIEISFVTDHVQEQFDKAIEAGALSILEPSRKPWGQLVSYVKDNNGCLVELCSPIET